MDNRPQGRQKNVTGTGKNLGRRGSGLGTGPVGAPGSGGGFSGGNNRPSGGFGGGRRSSGNQPTRAGGGGGLLKIIIIAALLLFGGGGGLSLLGGGGETAAPVSTQPAPTQQVQQKPADPFGFYGNSGNTGSTGSHGSTNPFFDYFGMFGGSASSGQYSGSTGSSAGWLAGNNTGRLNSSVSPAAREKYTQLKGSGRDTVTIMLYMCGTDLESKSAMGSKDLQEMVNASFGSNVNLLVYTGGCRQWRNSIVSSSVNQIYKVQDGGLLCVEKNAGNGSMTSPKTLASFIQFCAERYPANRNILILWDHGGGSISGYGYDEKSGTSAAMSLNGLDQALTAGKVKFDFVGFDACLMGSLETGLTMAKHADYLIASEETEPGLGWYYTNWLTTLGRNTSASTLELGRQIVDDFVTTSARSCPGQKTTLSLVDLSELERTIPEDFKSFSASMLEMIRGDRFAAVSSARSSVREFAVSSKTDQIDLVHMALKLNTPEGKALADTILAAVKYNRTSSDMTNAYGLSLYFPYRKMSTVNTAVNAYNNIGLDDTYTACIRAFASMESGGQAAAGGTTSPMTSLNGQSYGSASVGGDLLTQLLQQMLGGGGMGYFDRSVDVETTARYLAENRLDPDALVWTGSADGYVLHLPEAQWALVKDLELNVFADDGEGYIDLGLDTVYEFTENGDLLGIYDGSWLAIDDQNIAYYHENTTVDENGYTITGWVPVLLNGDRAKLILVFSSEKPDGFIAGARFDYREGQTDTVAKAITELEPGDVIDFLCDYYTYDGQYEDSYFLGEQHIYTGYEVVSNVYVPAPTRATYRVTDIYRNSFWTPEIP